MTENLLQKLEEKMVMVLSEVQDSRKEIQRLNYEHQRIANENSILKIEVEKYVQERQRHVTKLEELLSLFNIVNNIESTISNINTSNTNATAVKPVLIQA